MAVTTGKETGTTSNGSSSKPSGGGGDRGGGPGGGSLSAPNRTDPSKGAPASKAGPTTAAGKTDKAPSASTSTKPSNPTGGSLSAPARTAPSSGITGRTPAQQKAVDTAKQNATQYGGAQTSMQKAKTTSSAKVTDPSRSGITSPMSGQGTSYATPEAAKKANDKFTDTYGFQNRVTKGLPSAADDVIDKRGQMGPFKGDLPNGLMSDRKFGPFNPNNPYTRQQYNKDWRDYRDAEDADLRGLKGMEMDDDLRTPQEVREAVQRRMDQAGAIRANLDKKSLMAGEPTNEIARLQNEITSLKAKIDASRLTPNVPVGPSRGLSGLSSVFTGGNSTLADGSLSPSQSITAPGRTDRQTPQTSAPGKGDRQTPQTTAPGRDDRQTPQTTAPGRTDRQPSPTVSRPTNTSITAPGREDRQTPQTTAPGRSDRQTPQTTAPGREDRQTPQTVAPGTTDRAPSPTVSRPNNESFIDSLVNKGDYPGAYNASGSILGMQPTAPSLGQVMRQDPMSYMGPRAGTTPARPSTSVDMNASPVGETVQSQMIAERVVNAMKQAAMAQTRVPGLTRGIGPATTPAPQAPAPGKVSLPGPATPSMPDPRLAAMQEQFERIKMARGQIAAPQTVAPGRTDAVTPQTTAPGRQNLGDAVPTSAPPAATPPADYFNIQRTPGAPLVGNALQFPNLVDQVQMVRALNAGLMRHDQLNARQQAPTAPTAPAPQTVAPGRTDPVAPQTTAPGREDAVAPQTVAPGRTDPEMPQTVAPGRTDMEEASVPQDVPSGPLSSGRSVDDVLQEIALAEAAVNNLGMEEISEPVGPSRAPTEVDSDGYPQSVPPSQDGNYPTDDNFLQDAGQPQDLGELSNRYDYEKARAKEGLTQLAGRLFNAITSGDIRGFTPETNDKRAVNPPSMNRRVPQQAPMSDADAVMVARLLALIKEIEQQGGSQAQADLINSTFI